MNGTVRRLAAPVAVAFVCAVVAQADTLPARRAGLWELTVGASDGGTHSLRICLDRASDAALTSFGLGVSQDSCSRTSLHVKGSVATIDTECRFGRSDAASRSIISFTGDTAYHSETMTRYDPPFLGKSESKMTQDARWTGACPADMQPGDMVGPDGRRVSLGYMLQRSR